MLKACSPEETNLKHEMRDQIDGLHPYLQIASYFEDTQVFTREVDNYFRGGLVVSNPHVFVMAKPIKSDKDPCDQWYVENPDCWYVRWGAGKGCLKMMMDLVQPLPWVSFQRVQRNGLSEQRIYLWEKLYKKVSK